jgi:hypothetical protein
MRLIDYRHLGFSQFGEEGIVRRIFAELGTAAGYCCEFGAWDGVHLSNTHALMQKGWHGLLIESDGERFSALSKTYRENPRAECLRTLVDGASSSLPRIMRERKLERRLDFVSVDIDGLDYEVFASFTEFPEPPRVVCVEAATGHNPDDTRIVDRAVAATGVGQPLRHFDEIAKRMNYRLVCYLATNAFFMHRDVGREDEFPTLSPREAWLQNIELVRGSRFDREYLYRMNLGKQPPGFKFGNPLLSAQSLGISPLRAMALRFGFKPRE